MTEELNQVQDDMTTNSNESVVEDDDLFGDYDASLNEEIPSDFDDEGNQTSEEVPTQENEGNTQQVVSSHENTPFLKVKYNKEEKDLTQEEAITYAQKGMNYDNILGKYNALKEQEGTLSELSKLAERANMSTNDLLTYLGNQWAEHELDNEVNALKEKYPQSDESLLIELAKSHIASRTNLASQQKQETANARKQEISRQLDIFSKRYPDVDAQSLDPKVYQLMKDNYTLLEAYETVQAEVRAEEEKKKESLEKISKQNEENKKKSLGNTNNAGYDESNDDFLSGLFS